MRAYRTPTGAVHPAAHPLIHRIWQEMRRHQVSQEDVADRAGVSSSAMRKWRRGDRSPNLADVEAVLHVFDLEITVRGMRERA